jgi:hypothetical protein
LRERDVRVASNFVIKVDFLLGAARLMICKCPVVLNLRVLHFHGHDGEILYGMVDLLLEVIPRVVCLVQQHVNNVHHCLVVV